MVDFFIRLPALAAVLLAVTVVGCAGPQSSSTGSAPVQSASNAYPVPGGYVSGLRVLPYTGRIQTKCDEFPEPHRTYCIRQESGGR